MSQPDMDWKSGPKYKQIADAIGESIAKGDLVVGDQLPVQRDLAYRLGISLNTITRAYADATERGFLQGEVGRGTWVRATSPPNYQIDPVTMTRRETGPIDFSFNLPAPGKSAAALARTLAKLAVSDNLASFLDYQSKSDRQRHGEAAAKWLGGLNLKVNPGNIVITSGAQHGLMVALLATMRPGDVLLVEALTYGPIKALCCHLGLKVIPVALDEGGLSPGQLELICSKVAAKAVYCLPTIQTPTTATMSAERRETIAAIARKHDLLIIEDDVFGFLPRERPQPLAHFAPERTIYITSVSKSLAPGLRVGYVHAPDRYLEPLRAAVSLSCWMLPPLMAEIASRWIEDGTAAKLNAFQRSEATLRQNLATRILPENLLSSHPNGFHVWLALPSHWRSATFQMAAEQRGVKVLSGDMFSIEQNSAPSAIRMCLSHEVSINRVIKGLETIANLLKEPADPGAFIL
jgi:DNA-binding transcriptional MocR family regulator